MQVTFTGTRPGEGRVVSSILTNEVTVDLSSGVIRVSDGMLRKKDGKWEASVRLQKQIGRGCQWTKVAIRSTEAGGKSTQDFIVHVATKDGCPEEEARRMTWYNCVMHFFDGNDTAAQEHLKVWLNT